MDEHTPAYDVVARDYRRTRTLAATALDAWREALAPHFDRTVGTVLDVGAGTGQFTGAIADWFDAGVVALEPAAGMRAVATAAVPHRRVRHVAGRGEAIPLAAGSVDRAWLSAVVHHFVDPGLAFAEVRRVVRVGGLVLVRGFFRDLPLARHFTHFPGIERAVARFPGTPALTEAMASHGLVLVDRRDVVEVHTVAADWEARLEAQRSADSMLVPLTDAEFSTGVASLRSALHGSTPLAVTLRLLVCEVRA